MAKFDFKNCTYNKLWDSIEGRQLLTIMLNDPNIIRENAAYWKEAFELDPNPLPTNGDGTASFTVEAKEPSKANMMHWRAPLGDTIEKERGAARKYSGSIIDFIADGYREQAMERDYKARLIEQYGSDTLQLARWAIDVIQAGLKSADYTLSNMSAQIMSKGFIDYQGGLANKGAVLKADIPNTNFATAGEKVWADPDCLLIDQMVAIEKHYKEDVFGADYSMQWDIPYDVFHNVVLKNKQVVELIKSAWLVDKGQLADSTLAVSGYVVNEENFNKYIAQVEDLSPIHIVNEKQYNDGAIVNGWKQNTVVYRPIGYAGKILRTNILDERLVKEFGASDIQTAFATTANGLVLVENSVVNNGTLKEWQTKIMMSAVPVLTDFMWHVIVDIATAD